jgi:hypothetical protein
MEHTIHPEQIVANLIDNILTAANAGNKKRVMQLFPTLNAVITEFPGILWHAPHVWKLAKALLIIYHYDVLDDEDDSIQLVERAFMYAQRAVDIAEKQQGIVQNASYYEALHTQVVILSSCADCFAHSIADICAVKSHNDREYIQTAFRFSHTIISLMQYAILEKMEEHFGDFSQDAYVAELCNHIEQEVPDISAKNLAYAQKVQALMVHQIQIRNLLKD